MALSSKHPTYNKFVVDWETMRDGYAGERTIKGRRTVYLSATSGMRELGFPADKTEGWEQYQAYITRARYPDTLRDAVDALMGVMHNKPPTIELPKEMEFLRESVTTRNESLELLLQRINEQQLVSGRLGLLGDIPDRAVGKGKGQPYIALYEALSPGNWDEGRSDGIEIQNLNMVILDETAPERKTDFEWQSEQKFRVLLLTKDETDEAAMQVTTGGSGAEESIKNLPAGAGVYRMGVYREDAATSFDPSLLTTPLLMGIPANEIPFVFINTKDIAPEPTEPPLIGLANLSLAIYRGEADYRQSLFMQGQDTLVVIGASPDEKYRVGAHGAIELANVESDAKYIGVDSSGLTEQRESLENDYTRAAEKGGKLMDTMGSGSSQQSGEALRIRVASKTSSVKQMVITGAFGLQSILRIIARWMGGDTRGEALAKQVIITPNTDFTDDEMSGKEVAEFMGAKMVGAPIALETIHRRMEDRGVTDITFDEELALIKAEEPLVEPMSRNKEGPVEEEDDDDQDDDDKEE